MPMMLIYGKNIHIIKSNVLVLVQVGPNAQELAR
jgi:hypothetical protein